MSWDTLTAAQQDHLLRRPFDHFARYRLAAEIVTATAGPNARVLDLGGGPGSLQEFLPDARVTSTDLVLPGKWHEQAPDLVLADGAALPFGDRSFDVVVSLDTLEHVVPDSRTAFIDEVVRVSGSWALVVCPYGTPGVADADQALRDYVAARFAPDMPTIRILDEHLGYGHPDLQRTVAQMDVHGEVDVLPSGRLDRWFAGMITFFHLLALADDEPVEVTQRFINRTFYAADLSGPAYRHAVLLRREDADTGPSSPQAVLEPLAARAASDPAAAAQLDLLRIVLAESLVDSTARARAELQQRTVEMQVMRQDTADALARTDAALATAAGAQQAQRDVEDQMATLKSDLDAARQQIAGLEAFRSRVLDNPVWRTARTVRDTFKR